MPPAKRRAKSQIRPEDVPQSEPPQSKRLSKGEREKLIVKSRLDALEQEESLIKDDRLSIEEKKRLIDAYNDHGFHVFYNPELLINYLPNRRVSDIKGLVQRLQSNLQVQMTADQSKNDQPDCSKLDEWEKLCSHLTRNFAKDRKINLDDVFTDTLKMISSEFKQISASESGPNYSELLENFAQLMAGKFPERTSSINGQISRQIFEHINSLVDSIDLKPIVGLFESGKWMEEDLQERLKFQEMALDGLEELSGQPPTHNAMNNSEHIEALCLELPKIKRLTEMLNPLRVNKNLMESTNKLDAFEYDK